MSGVPLELLVGIDRVRDILLDNTERFAAGRPANNALLWGARGMGKSSLIKAIHGRINAARPQALALIEIHREDIDSLPRLLQRLARTGRRCLLFCDDLSFDLGDTTYKSLKAVLEGGIDGRPDNVLFYATSNRRHLMPRDMIENERATAIHPAEALEEKVSLSDRFGLWLGFHPCSQDDYLAMVDGYVRHFGLRIAPQRCGGKPWSGRRPAAPARDGSPGSTSRTSPGGKASRPAPAHRVAPCCDAGSPPAGLDGATALIGSESRKEARFRPHHFPRGE